MEKRPDNLTPAVKIIESMSRDQKRRLMEWLRREIQKRQQQKAA